MKPWFLTLALAVIPAFGRRKQKGQQFEVIFGYRASEVSLGYIKPCGNN